MIYHIDFSTETVKVRVKGCRILWIFGERHNDLSEKTVEKWVI